MVRLFYIVFLGIMLLPACSFSKKKKNEVRINPNVRLSGRVQSVNQEDKFVLIRRYGRWHVGEGQLVESRGEGRSANLMPTGEELGEHVAADIRSGEVEVGDGVYIRQMSSPAPAVPQVPSPASESATEVKAPSVESVPLLTQPIVSNPE